MSYPGDLRDRYPTTWRRIQEMRALQEKYAPVGACDTEARAALVAFLEGRAGDDLTYFVFGTSNVPSQANPFELFDKPERGEATRRLLVKLRQLVRAAAQDGMAPGAVGRLVGEWF